jgi:cysteine-rich repeat protein
MRRIVVLFGVLLALSPAVLRAQSAPVCGNGTVESGEECDDGNQDNYDSCLNSCKSRGGFEAPTPAFDPDIAFRRAIVSTFFFPPGLGIVFGPSMGHFYAGAKGRGVAMSLLRGALLGGVVGLSAATAKGKLSGGASSALLSIDLTLLGILIGADLLDAPKAAERANKK